MNYGSLAVFIIIPFIWFGMIILIYSTSCGGRENCGKRFCPIGLFNDYGFIPAIIVLIAIESLILWKGGIF